MRIVVALGGNALLKRGEPMTEEVQRANIRVAAKALAPVAQQHQLVLAHGNGPQVGLLALQASAYKDVEAYPLDVLGAQTEGMIGYMIEQEMGNLLPFEVPFATLLTMVILGLVQVVVHLICFLHMNFSSEGRWNVMAFIFTAIIILLVVGLSLWIIYTADALMMPMP